MIEIRAERSAYQRATHIWVVDHDPQQGRLVGAALGFRFVEAGEFSEPTLRISDESAQQWIDELWRAGFRPSEGTGSAGSLAATERHLEDMRRLVFDRPEVHVEVETAPAARRPRSKS